jgi:hypothetical protein
MITKTWKIGECAQGGIITVEIRGKVIAVIGKEWDYSAGDRRSSDQSKAKEFTRGTQDATNPEAYFNLSDFLNDLTTYYYADEIMKWIESKVVLASHY